MGWYSKSDCPAVRFMKVTFQSHPLFQETVPILLFSTGWFQGMSYQEHGSQKH